MPHVTKLEFKTNPKRLKDALDNLLDKVGLTRVRIEHKKSILMDGAHGIGYYDVPDKTKSWKNQIVEPQMSLTSVLGDDNWNESTGKIKDLRYPEKAYSVVNESLKGSYIEELILAFPDFTRWRLLKLASRTNYSIHHDSDNGKQNLRIHIPVVTNSDSYLMFFDKRTEPKMYHLEAGSSYRVNTTGLHSAINFGTEDRYHIVGVKYLK
jgi:hypothetical protein